MEEVIQNNKIIKPPRKKKKIIIISIIIAILITAGGIYSWLKYQKVQEEKYAKIQAETIVDMHIQFLLATIIVGTYSNVWDRAIDNGNDFNIALTNFKEGLKDKGTLGDLEKKQDEIRDNMKLLQNPPKEYMESYIVLKETYGTYTKMMEQALSPSGSLLEFNRKTNDLYSNFEEQMERLEITLPADVKKIKKKFEKEKKTDENKDSL